MTKKLLLAAGSLMLLPVTLALQGCFDSGPDYGYGPGYYGGPAYYSEPVYAGDYDEHHSWHDRDWWVNNRRDWAEDHHQEWFSDRHEDRQEARRHSEHDRD